MKNFEQDFLSEETGIGAREIERFAIPGPMTDGMTADQFGAIVAGISKALLAEVHPDKQGGQNSEMMIGQVDVRDLLNTAGKIKRLSSSQVAMVLDFFQNEDERLAELRRESQFARARYDELQANVKNAAIIEESARRELGDNHINRLSANMYRRDFSARNPLDLVELSFQNGTPNEYTRTLQAKSKGKISGTPYAELWENLQSTNKALVQVNDGVTHELFDGIWTPVMPPEAKNRILQHGYIVFSPIHKSRDVAYIEYPKEHIAQKRNSALQDKWAVAALNNHNQLPDLIQALLGREKHKKTGFRNSDLQLPPGSMYETDKLVGMTGSRYVISPELYYYLASNGYTSYSAADYYHSHSDPELTTQSILLQDTNTQTYHSVDYDSSFMRIDLNE